MLKKFVGGGTKLLVSILTVFILLCSSTFAFAEDVGDTINYTSRNGQRRFFASGGWKGGCAEFGVDAASSGTARVTQTYTNTSDIAKLLYYYGEQQGWFDNDDYVLSGYVTTKHEMLNHLMRIKVMGYSAWASAVGNASAAQELYETFYAKHSQLPDAPSNFEVIYCDAGSNQNFMLYRMGPSEGKLKLKKSSANTSITG